MPHSLRQQRVGDKKRNYQNVYFYLFFLAITLDSAMMWTFCDQEEMPWFMVRTADPTLAQRTLRWHSEPYVGTANPTLLILKFAIHHSPFLFLPGRLGGLLGGWVRVIYIWYRLAG